MCLLQDKIFIACQLHLLFHQELWEGSQQSPQQKMIVKLRFKTLLLHLVNDYFSYSTFAGPEVNKNAWKVAKKMGPNTEPCGTPQVTLFRSDLTLFYLYKL